MAVPCCTNKRISDSSLWVLKWSFFYQRTDNGIGRQFTKAQNLYPTALA